MIRLKGHDAVQFARQHDLDGLAGLCHYNTPIEDAREGVTIEVAEEIAQADPSLVYLDLPEGSCPRCSSPDATFPCACTGELQQVCAHCSQHGCDLQDPRCHGYYPRCSDCGMDAPTGASRCLPCQAEVQHGS